VAQTPKQEQNLLAAMRADVSADCARRTMQLEKALLVIETQDLLIALLREQVRDLQNPK
jgi:hypothetical protein